MKEEAPPWQSFYGGAKVWPAGQGRWPGDQLMWPEALQFVPKGVVVEIKRKMVEGKCGKRGGRWPAG
jgi:hypothetical protein